MPRRGPSAIIPLLVVILAAGGCAAIDGDPGLDDRLVDALHAVVEESAEDAVGGTLVRVSTPEGDLELAEGLSDLRTGDDLSPDAAFRIASITKLFTAAVVLQLVEEGLLDLDAPVADVIPERAAEFEFGDRITPRHLLAHTAGVEDYLGIDRELGRVPPGEESAFFSDLAETVAIEDGAVSRACEDGEYLATYAYASEEALFEPGTDWSYSNTGYIMLGEVIETVTDTPLEAVYRQRLLDPLGLDDTWLTCAEEPRTELARGYHPPGALGISVPGQGSEPFDVTELNEPYWAAGDLVSTAEDLTSFARGLFTGELFDDAHTLETMLEPGVNRAYGLGVRVEDDALGHGGLAAGYDATLRYYPSADAVVVAAVNESSVEAAAEVEARIRAELAEPAAGK